MKKPSQKPYMLHIDHPDPMIGRVIVDPSLKPTQKPSAAVIASRPHLPTRATDGSSIPAGDPDLKRRWAIQTVRENLAEKARSQRREQADWSAYYEEQRRKASMGDW